jgi:hypothetical protein
VLMAISLGHGITTWYPSSLYIVLPYLAKDLGLSYGQVGVLMGWNYFSSFLVNLPGGFVVDMVGKTGFILGLSLALIGLPYCFLGFSTSYALALIVVTFVGTGSNLWHPAALSLLERNGNLNSSREDNIVSYSILQWSNYRHSHSRRSHRSDLMPLLQIGLFRPHWETCSSRFLPQGSIQYWQKVRLHKSCHSLPLLRDD